VYCVYSFNQRKDGQTHCDSFTNANYSIIIKHKLREAKVLSYYVSWWKIHVPGVVAWDKGAILGDTNLHGVFDW